MLYLSEDDSSEAEQTSSKGPLVKRKRLANEVYRTPKLHKPEPKDKLRDFNREHKTKPQTTFSNPNFQTRSSSLSLSLSVAEDSLEFHLPMISSQEESPSTAPFHFSSLPLTSPSSPPLFPSETQKSTQTQVSPPPTPTKQRTQPTERALLLQNSLAQNRLITDTLTRLSDVYAAEGKICFFLYKNLIFLGKEWNSVAIKKAVNSLLEYQHKIKSGKDVSKLPGMPEHSNIANSVPGVGSSVVAKIDEILTHGNLSYLETEMAETYLLFMSVWGMNHIATSPLTLLEVLVPQRLKSGIRAD